METLRIGPGVPQPTPARRPAVTLADLGGQLARGLAVGLGLGLGLTLWVAVGSLI